jgi:hypothetical protein
LLRNKHLDRLGTKEPSRKEGVYPVPKKDSLNGAEEMYIPNYGVIDFGLPKGEQALHRDLLAVAEEMYIPDYVMLDFGSPQGTPASGKPPA